MLRGACAASCPAGYLSIDNPFVTIADTCSGDAVSVGVVEPCTGTSSVCWIMEQLRELCGAGVTQLKTSGGLNFPLYSTRATTPSLCVGYNNTTCYVDLESGSATGAININYNGVTYHTIK